MKTKSIFLIAVTAFAAVKISAQDYHLSQYEMAPHYFNPALTGIYFGEKNPFRICSNYRSQWQKLQGKPYSSVAVSFDMPINRFGAGIFVMDNIAGTANFGTFNMQFAGAYTITNEQSKNHLLTTGLQLGMIQKRFLRSDLTYESQYVQGSGIDTDLPTNEFFARDRKLSFDANLGMYYRYTTNDRRYAPYVGFSVYHLSMPNQSFSGAPSRLPMRFNANIGCEMQLSEMVTVTPHGLFMYQGKATEINAGVMGAFRLGETPYELLTGGNYRHKDAVVFQLGMKQGSNVFRISYDFVTSYLRHFSGRRGGFEMGIIYTGVGGGRSAGKSRSTLD